MKTNKFETAKLNDYTPEQLAVIFRGITEANITIDAKDSKEYSEDEINNFLKMVFKRHRSEVRRIANEKIRALGLKAGTKVSFKYKEEEMEGQVGGYRYYKDGIIKADRKGRVRIANDISKYAISLENIKVL